MSAMRISTLHVSCERERGAALLLVIWLIALLAAVIGGFAMAARIEHLQGTGLARGLVATQAARAGLEYALVRVADDDARTRWQPDGRVYEWRFGTADVDVRIVDATGLIDLNTAQQPLLARLFSEAGEIPDQAARIAGAVVDWRDADTLTQPAGGAEDSDYAAAGRPYGARDAAFQTVSELQQVLGMTPALFARIADSLTVFSPTEMPDARFAPEQVLAAMGLDAAQVIAQREGRAAHAPDEPQLQGADALPASGSGTYSIRSHARLRDGRESTLRVVLRTGDPGLPGMAYLPLQWEEGTSLR